MNTLHLLATLLPLLAIAFARSALEEGGGGDQEVEKAETPASSKVSDLPSLLDDKCECNTRYFRHYEAKKCKPVYEEGCRCPKRFDCPKEEPVNEHQTVCEFRGQTFAPGDSVPTTNPCKLCSCQLDYITSNPIISCIAVECGSMFRGRLDEGCYDVFEENLCCPTDVKCVQGTESNKTETTSNATASPTCEFEGKTYQLGQRMHSEDDPCLMCLCNENYHGVSSIRDVYAEKHSNGSCHIHDCEMDLRKETFQPGCIPIYHDKTCCPIEYHCVTGSEEVVPLIPSHSHASTATNETDLFNHCTFGSKSYNIGDELDIHHPTHCVTCTCQTPPEITCVHKACPYHDYEEHCHAIYVPGQCCPTYDCQPMSAPVQCAPVQCQGDCVEVSVPNGCPMCMCQNLLCSPPQCQPGCEINYDVSVGSCPTCKCPEDDISKTERPICDPVKCSSQCFEGISPQGCPMCVCGPVCYPPKCDEGCHVQLHVPEGQCPGCECPNTTDSLSDLNVLCSPVKCPPLCHEVMGNAGCPTCQCDVMCSLPKCMPGCHIEAPPYAGPCPGCVCGDTVNDIQCAPVKCEHGCTEVMVPNGCSMCQCGNILCSPPKCQEGCTVDTEVPSGGCPGCKCPPTMPLDRPMCGPVKCGPQCHEGISPQGCPMCVCGPLCSPPKCDEGCRIQTKVPDGQCPGCECDGDAEHRDLDHKIRCSPVMCPSICRKTIGSSGCETCECDPVCSPPQCAPGCRVETVPSSGPCPGCICDSAHNPLMHCSPVKCDPGCQQRIDYARSPCPFCACDIKESDEEHEQSTPPKILCSPPKCEAGCFPKLIPPGTCPTCFCGEEQDKVAPGLDVQCSPVKCEPGCHEENDPSRGPCPHCVCDGRHFRSMPVMERLDCIPPMCDPGCYPKVVRPNRCPTCFCRKDGRVGGMECPQMICELPCRRVALTPWSCPMCVCDNSPMCTVPECKPGCHHEVNSATGCHECVCSDQTKNKTGQQIQCAPVKCDPPCHETTNEYGCPSCLCNPIMCSPPKCKPGREAKLLRGPCPACTY